MSNIQTLTTNVTALVNEVNELIDKNGEAFLDMPGIKIMRITKCWEGPTGRIGIEGDCRSGYPGYTASIYPNKNYVFIKSIREEN